MRGCLFRFLFGCRVCMADFEDAVYMRVVQYVAISWLRKAKVGLACAHVFSQPVFLGLFGAVA